MSSKHLLLLIISLAVLAAPALADYAKPTGLGKRKRPPYTPPSRAPPPPPSPSLGHTPLQGPEAPVLTPELLEKLFPGRHYHGFMQHHSPSPQGPMPEPFERLNLGRHNPPPHGKPKPPPHWNPPPFAMPPPPPPSPPPPPFAIPPPPPKPFERLSLGRHNPPPHGKPKPPPHWDPPPFAMPPPPSPPPPPPPFAIPPPPPKPFERLSLGLHNPPPRGKPKPPPHWDPPPFAMPPLQPPSSAFAISPPPLHKPGSLGPAPDLSEKLFPGHRRLLAHASFMNDDHHSAHLLVSRHGYHHGAHPPVECSKGPHM